MKKIETALLQLLTNIKEDIRSESFMRRLKYMLTIYFF